MNNGKEYSLTLGEPARIRIQTPDKSQEVVLDLYEAWKLVAEAEKQPSDDQRWKVVRGWLALKLGVNPDDLAENQLREFHNAVVALGNIVEEETKKKLLQIASLPQPTQASQQTTSDGLTGSNESGSETSPTLQPN